MLYDTGLSKIKDCELEENLKTIDQGNLDVLYEERICPTGKINKSKRLLTISFIVLKNYWAVEQFRNRLENVDRALTLKENYDKMKYFLIPVNYQLT